METASISIMTHYESAVNRGFPKELRTLTYAYFYVNLKKKINK